MSKLMKQMSYSIIPGKTEKIQEICDKFQAIIDRNNKNMSLARDVSFKESKDFYSMIIPNLSQKLQNAESMTDLEKNVTLSKIVQEWILENGKKCSNYLNAFDKGKLTTKKQTFKNILDSVSDDLSFKSKDTVISDLTIIKGDPLPRDSGTNTIVRGGAGKSKTKSKKKILKKTIPKKKTVTKVKSKTKSKKTVRKVKKTTKK
jgi:hypothetical protein